MGESSMWAFEVLALAVKVVVVCEVESGHSLLNCLYE